MTGLKPGIRRSLDALSRRKIPAPQVISPELSRDLAHISHESGRQIGLLIARDGAVETVLVGGPRSLYIPDLPKNRAGRKRLRGLRLVHTHLEAEPLTEEDLMDLVFLRLDCIAAVEVDRNGGAVQLDVAHILPSTRRGENGWQLLAPMPCHDPDLDFPALVRSIEDELEGNLAASNWAGKKGQERAILVSVAQGDRESAQMSMAELIELAAASGIEAADTVIQMRRQKNPKYFIGRGKLSEIVLRALQCGVDLLIFDQELNPSQVRAITDTTELRVVDRTQLILDIFAQRAQSREGKIQVEMAQLKYLLPRLGVKDDALSRLTGGIGARGPGETTLEINRRRIKDRIAQLEDSLKNLGKRRTLRRTRRTRKEIPVISIVGYTNAGKSTLLNALTHSSVLAQDKLFATLDPVSRRLRFPKDFEVIITDTVGFIKNLPKDLIDAFAATLEELQEADLLLHIVDIGNPRFEDQIEAVQNTLSQLELDKKPTLMVFNKIDTVDPDFAERKKRKHEGITISAVNPRTLHPLIEAMEERIAGFLQRQAGLAQREDRSTETSPTP